MRFSLIVIMDFDDSGWKTIYVSSSMNLSLEILNMVQYEVIPRINIYALNEAI